MKINLSFRSLVDTSNYTIITEREESGRLLYFTVLGTDNESAYPVISQRNIFFFNEVCGMFSNFRVCIFVLHLLFVSRCIKICLK